MEGVPLFPEYSADDDPASAVEKKDKKSKKKLALFEKPNDDKSPEKDKEPPLEKLSEDEKKTIVEQYIGSRTTDVKQELAVVADDSPEEAVVLANAELLENIKDRIEAEEPITEELLDAAVAETLAELGIEDGSDEIEPDKQELKDEVEPGEEDDPDAATTLTPTMVVSLKPTIPTPPTSSPIRTSLPTPPTPTLHTPPPSSPSHHTPTKSPDTLVVSDKRRERANLLVGGILGYLLGRRRGRIKTEKKLIPVQEKLQREVLGLHDQILVREEKIRKLTYEQSLAKPSISEKIFERSAAVPESIDSKKPRREKLGKFAVLSERPDRSPEIPNNVDNMPLPELLAVASNIKIEQSSARNLFESRNLNEEGLRRVVKAYLRGERYEKVITENILSPEIYREPIESADKASGSIDAVSSALSDNGSGSSFALPSVNQQLQSSSDPQNTRPKINKNQSPATPVIVGLIIGLIVAAVMVISS